MILNSTATIRAGRPKSEEKRQQILLAAVDLFLAQGVSNTSMDNVAKHSGVSKQTVYSHFENKDMLYTAVIDHKCREYRLDHGFALQDVEGEAPLRQALTELGKQFMSLMQDPQVIAMYRIVIGEAQNAPHVAELFYQAGPRASLKALAGLFEQASGHQLNEQVGMQLAIDFFSLLKGDFYIRCLFGLAEPLSGQQIAERVELAVKKILLIFAQQRKENQNS